MSSSPLTSHDLSERISTTIQVQESNTDRCVFQMLKEKAPLIENEFRESLVIREEQTQDQKE